MKQTKQVSQKVRTRENEVKPIKARKSGKENVANWISLPRLHCITKKPIFCKASGQSQSKALEKNGLYKKACWLVGVLTATSYQIIKGDMTSSPPNTESWLTVLKSALPFSNNVSNRHYFLLVIRSGSNNTMYRYLLEESPFFYLLFVLGNCSAL